MKKYSIEIKWGIYFVLMSLLWMLLEKLAGLHSAYIHLHSALTNLMAIPAIAFYVFALLEKKKNFYNGIMSYRQGFLSGLVITLVATILSPLSQVITSEIITPEFFPNAINYAVSNGYMPKEYAEKYFTLGSYIVQGLIGAPIMGLITSAIVAFFTKSKK